MRLPHGSLRRRFVISSSWALCTATLSRGATMLTWVLCARLMPLSDYGALTLIYNTVTSAGTLATFGLGVTTTKHVAELRTKDPARAGRIVHLSSVVSACSGLLLAGIFIAFAHPIASRVLRDPQLTASVALAAALVLFNATNTHQQGVLAGLEAFRQLAHLSFWTGLLCAAISVAATYAAGVRGAIVAFVAGQGITWLMYHIVLKRSCHEWGLNPLAPGWTQEARVLIHFSLPALMTALLMSPLGPLTQYAVSRLPDGMKQLAIYNAADRWRAMILFLPTVLFQTVLPILSNISTDTPTRQFRRVVRTNLLLGGGLVAVAAVLSPIAAPSAMGAFGRGYRAGTSILSILCVSAVPQVLNGVLGQAIVTRSMWMRFFFDLLLFSSLVAAALVLVPEAGAIGLALAYAIAFSVTAVALAVYAYRKDLI